MKMISQTQVQRVPSQEWSITSRHIDRATRLARLGWEIAEEVGATFAGVFEMPLRHPVHDKRLDGLDDHLLTDIGYKRVRFR